MFLVVALGHAGCVPASPSPPDSQPPVADRLHTATGAGTRDNVPLQRTRIVASLDIMPNENENIVWCASFEAAWKQLQNSVFQAPVTVAGADEFTNSLNEATLPAFPEGSLFAAAGTVKDNIQQTIVQGLRAQFPGKVAPKFSVMTERDVVAYSYLEVQSEFTQPYRDNPQPLTFTSRDGRTSSIRAFGVQPSDRDVGALRSQPQVLYLNRTDPEEDYFVIDLCANGGDTQVLFARLKRIGTLQDTLSSVCRQLAPQGDLDKSQTLLAPQMVFKLARRFEEIIGRQITTPKFEDLRISEAVQDIDFSLTKTGVVLKSEARIVATASLGPDRSRLPDFICDRPCAILLKKRDAPTPYFVIWIENDELLTAW